MIYVSRCSGSAHHIFCGYVAEKYNVTAIVSKCFVCTESYSESYVDSEVQRMPIWLSAYDESISLTSQNDYHSST